MNGDQHFHNFPQRNIFLPERNTHQLFGKVYRRADDARVERMQVFQQPDAGRTMDSRDKKRYFTEPAI